jgi:hypothetical protein
LDSPFRIGPVDRCFDRNFFGGAVQFVETEIPYISQVKFIPEVIMQKACKLCQLFLADFTHIIKWLSSDSILQT